MDLLRLATAGSVDDGKSTLIGRLLYETASVPKDKLAAIEAASRRRGADGLDLSLLTDGLIAEREQGITIDVAHMYFATPRRRFIIADTPGHVEYTRNMVTGASTASVSVILIDARNGLLEQTHRHYYISALLRIPTVIVAINKMDLVGYAQARFDEIAAAFRAMAAPVQPAGQTLQIMPVSSLYGENITRRSAHLSWYDGPTLLDVLESADVHQRSTLPGRLQIQRVLRPRHEGAHDIRSYAGRIASGTFHVGDTVAVLPGGRTTRIAALNHLGASVGEAEAGQSISVDFEDDVDVGRGSLVVPTSAAGPTLASRQQIDATVCWLDENPLRPGRVYLVQHGVQRVRAKFAAITGLVDVSTLQITAPPDRLQLNQLATVTLRLAEPIVMDAYEDNPPNGAFIVIDADSNATAAVGFVAAEPVPVDEDL
jgi:sulfate adenylyltransferase subunit 1